MAEQYHVVSSYAVVTCDSCGLEEVGPLRNGYAPPHELANQLADNHGWRVYAGRDRRNYCPECGPSRGHRMRLVRGTEEGRK